jgi:hypothetical protein
MGNRTIDEVALIEDYRSLREAALLASDAKDFDKALTLIETAAHLNYLYNLSPLLSDINLENHIEYIASNCFQSFSFETEENTVLFFDYFGYDNRGLTQQYLRALMRLGKKIVYVLETSQSNFPQTDIYRELKQYDYSNIHILTGDGPLAKIKEVIQILSAERPSKVLMHLAPWDVIAYSAFYLVKDVIRYQINLTDHAFWLGVGITDVCLEFRNFGFAVSKRRGISPDKIRILPFYPINNDYPFEGIPSGAESKKIIFVGGSIYKILGEGLIFVDLLKKILDIDESLVVVLAGSGNLSPIKDFIESNSLKDRFFFLGNRRDITAVLQKSNYFFTTYPFTGALMSQIAAAQGIPIFSFSTEKFQCNQLDDVFYKFPLVECFDTVDQAVDRFKAVWQDDAYLKGYGDALINSMISPDEFKSALKQIFDGANPFAFLEKKVNVEDHQKVYGEFLMESENKYNPQYDKFIKNKLTRSERRKILPEFFRLEQRHNLKHDKKSYLKNLYRAIFPR